MVMKRIRVYVLGACMAVATMSLTSCSTKQHAIKQLEDFSYELQYKSKYYSVNEWKDAADDFIRIRKNISKHEMDYTPEEKARIGELEGECAGYMAKGVKNGFFDKLKGFKNELVGVLEGILHSFLH